MTLQFRFFRWLSLMMMPCMHFARNIYLREKILVLSQQFPDVDLNRKFRAAIHIATQGVETVDITFLAALMSPKKEFTYAEAEREALAILDKVLLGQLAAMPQSQKMQILQDQAERLFSDE